MIIYLHGYGSSGNAFKARLLKRIYHDIEMFSPDLPPDPDETIRFLEAVIQEKCQNQPCMLIGSSLGGFYALHLHIKFKLYAVLLNPTIQPIDDLERRLVTEPEFDNQAPRGLIIENLNQMMKYYHHPELIHGDRLRVYLNRDDEVLDYRNALHYFQKSDCEIILNDKGEHVFLNFTDILTEIIETYRAL